MQQLGGQPASRGAISTLFAATEPSLAGGQRDRRDCPAATAPDRQRFKMHRLCCHPLEKDGQAADPSRLPSRVPSRVPSCKTRRAVPPPPCPQARADQVPTLGRTTSACPTGSLRTSPSPSTWVRQWSCSRPTAWPATRMPGKFAALNWLGMSAWGGGGGPLGSTVWLLSAIGGVARRSRCSQQRHWT